MAFPALGDRYRIERELGRGGMATVWLAEDVKHRRRVAIKVLSPELAAALGRERFLREIEIVAGLSHPHIVPLHDSGGMGESLYYVMPLIEGETLRQRLRREGALPVDESVRIAREIAGALAYAHGRGVVHRDVKPENILLSAGIALVADFGIAREIAASAPTTVDATGAAHTAAGVSLGTPAYMAPEQVTGGAVDGRTDLYALGCVLHEMLAGAPPFSGPQESLLHQHVTSHPVPLGEIRPTVPGALAATVTQALAKMAADRPTSMARFATMLEEATARGPGGSTSDDGPGAIVSQPKPRTRFIGRERELAEVPRFLEETRLVTLTGIGGCGKTRLALEVAYGAAGGGAYANGVWFVDLAPLRDPERVLAAVASALGIAEVQGRELASLVAARLHGGSHLVVLDNCEHVLAAAASVARILLDASPGVAVLATSREGLGLDGERLLGVRSLAVPAADRFVDVDSARESEAVRLFVDRARLVDPSFTLDASNAPVVAEIGRRLDGIPLALELAAARVRVLSVAEIRDRLDDRFRLLTGGSRSALPRQQTLLAAIQWSDDQLAENERELFHGLSIFADAFTLERAARVAAGDDDPFATLDLLARLVDKSLVEVEKEPGGTRYRLLETMRQYGQDRLRETGRYEALGERHAADALERAERGYAERHVIREEWVRTLRADDNDFAAALDFLAARDPERRLALAANLGWYWFAFSHVREGRRQLDAALAAVSPTPPRPAHARALLWAGSQLAWSGDTRAGIASLKAGLAEWRILGDRRQIAFALDGLGYALFLAGELEDALARFGESLEAFAELGDTYQVNAERSGVAQVLVALGRIDEARPVARAIVDYFGPIGDRRTEHIGWHLLGDCALMEGKRDESIGLYRKSLVLCRDVADRLEMSFEVQGVAMSLAERAPAQALSLAAAAFAEWERIGAAPSIRFWDELLERNLGLARGRLSPDEAAQAEAEGLAMSFERAVNRALGEPA
jgi:predicted ATPase/tRNA A-37 threonylcarbamoyl transferase component Bud32